MLEDVDLMRGLYKTLCMVLIMSILISLSGCVNGSGSPVGKWYNSNGLCLDIRSDGTYKLDNDYGIGKWKFLADKVTIEFTDFYGDIQDLKIEKSELGDFIHFGNEDFYKNAYPSIEDISEVQAKNATELDPFDGIDYVISGISPYCYISVDNKGCSEEVQKYVTYNLDKDYYRNGERATITANIIGSYSKDYVLTESKTEYSISGQPEYVQDLNGVDLTLLKSELSDYALAEKSKIVGTKHAFGCCIVDSWSPITSVNSVTPESTSYFSVLKPIKYDEIQSDEYFNCLSTIYRVNVNDGDEEKKTAYVCVNAYNIVEYPDKSIKWGSESIDNYDFLCVGSGSSAEDCVTSCVMCNSVDYNISTFQLD